MAFDHVPIIEMPGTLGEAALDGLPLGVAKLDSANVVESCDAHEGRYSGLPRGIVVGRHLPSGIAPRTLSFRAGATPGSPRRSGWPRCSACGSAPSRTALRRR